MSPVNRMPVSFRRKRSESPVSRLFDLDRDLQDFFEDFSIPMLREDEEHMFAPVCDVSETKNQYILKFDVPGVKKENIKIELEGNRLMVSGERKEEKKEEGEKRYFSETRYGHFTRTFTLPEQVDPKKVKADFKEGVLKVEVPKTEKSQRREIEIH
jgi:HSP20 family protein